MDALVPRFDVTSSELVRNGGACWIALDDGGRVHLHVTLARKDFKFRGRTIHAGTLGNLVASRDYRCLFPAASLLSQLVRDVSNDSLLDFLYSDPPPASAAVAKTAGLQQLASLDRFVIPLTDERSCHALAARAYLASLRLRHVFNTARCATLESTGYDVARFEAAMTTPNRLQPQHPDSMYRRRLNGYPGPDYSWCEFRLRGHGRASKPDAIALLYGPNELHFAHVLGIRRAPGVALSALIPGLLRAARERGAHRLQIETIRESHFARELQRAGFRKRDDLLPIFGKAVTPVGGEVVNAVDDWEITALDMER
jgi:hypothetical protein